MFEYFREFKPSVQLIFFIIITIVSAIIITFLGSFIAMPFFGMDAMLNMQENSSLMRYMQGVSQVGMFLFPAFIFAYIFYENPATYFSFRIKNNYIIIGLFLLLFLSSIPIVEALSILNQSFSFPESLKGFEISMRELTEKNELLMSKMLNDKTIAALLANLFIVGIIPAFAEELFFRGVLQQLLIKWTNKPHLSIIIIAIVFSAFHFDFLNFLPRVFLGLILGYAFYYTKTIWTPIIIHLVNNVSSVLIYYFSSESLSSSSDTFYFNDKPVLIIISVILFVTILFIIKRQLPKQAIIDE